MNKQALTAGILGLMLGLFITNLVKPKHVALSPTPAPSVNHAGHTMESMTMDQMVASLKGKSGDEFDMTFLREMIDHHQGAIDMAKLVKESAKHDELKQMADEIISAQTHEIEQMNTWQKEWGYAK